MWQSLHQHTLVPNSIKEGFLQLWQDVISWHFCPAAYITYFTQYNLKARLHTHSWELLCSRHKQLWCEVSAHQGTAKLKNTSSEETRCKTNLYISPHWYQNIGYAWGLLLKPYYDVQKLKIPPSSHWSPILTSNSKGGTSSSRTTNIRTVKVWSTAVHRCTYCRARMQIFQSKKKVFFTAGWIKFSNIQLKISVTYYVYLIKVSLLQQFSVETKVALCCNPC